MHPVFKIHRTTASRFKLRDSISAAQEAAGTLKLDHEAAVVSSSPMDFERAVNGQTTKTPVARRLRI
jgi:hypothetical protein